jgi:hypothetical protein
MKPVSALPECSTALRELLRRQVRAIVLLWLRVVACALLLTLLKPLWHRQSWLDTLLFGIGALLCGVPLLREVGRNWGWRIALGQAYLTAGRDEDAERVLAPLRTIQGQLFDPTGQGRQALAKLQERHQAQEGA